MAYYMDVVSHSLACPSLQAIEIPLFSEFDASYEIRGGTEDDWREIELLWVEPDDDEDEDDGFDARETGRSAVDGHDPADEFATIIRRVNPAEVAKYVESFREELLTGGVRPERGSRWVADWLQGAQTWYSFTPHSSDRDDEAMDVLRAIMWSIQRDTNGLAYADLEGWSNQEGDQITWQFTERPHTGLWWFAVLDDSGAWQRCRIDLSDTRQCEEFRSGRIPRQPGDAGSTERLDSNS
jgi:hypothetical protein